MEIPSLVNFYLDPASAAPQQELKPMKAPDCDKDVQRFEAILGGEGPYQPKSLDLVVPGTEPNAIQSMGHNIIDKVTEMKSSTDSRMERINIGRQKAIDGDLDLAGFFDLQWQCSMFGVETSLMSKSGDKASEGIKTMFNNR